MLRIGNPVLPIKLHGIPYIFIWIKAHAGHHPCLRYLVIRSWTIANLSPSVRSVKYPHSCGSFGFHSLPPFPRPYTTTLPPYSLHFGANSWPLRGSELTLSPPAVLTDWVPSLSTPSACRSLSMPFRFDTRTGLRPGCCISSVISTNDFAYLPGLPLHVPRRLWKVAESNRLLT